MFTATFDLVTIYPHDDKVYRGVVTSDRGYEHIEYVGESLNIRWLKRAMNVAGFTKENTIFGKVPKK